MRIFTFTGAHSTGKTTLLKKMKEDKRFKGWKFVNEITRSIAATGKEINEKGDEDTQIAVINSHYVNIVQEDDIEAKVLDRWALDGCAYTQYLHDKGRVTEATLMRSIDQLMAHQDRFDVIFYIEPEFGIANDGVRSLDLKFQRAIADIFKELIDDLDIKVVKLSGTIEERYKTILQNI